MFWTLFLSFGLLFLCYRAIVGFAKDVGEIKRIDEILRLSDNPQAYIAEYHKLRGFTGSVTVKGLRRNINFGQYVISPILIAITAYYGLMFFPIPVSSFTLSSCEQAYVQQEVKKGDVFHYRMLKKARTACATS